MEVSINGEKMFNNFSNQQQLIPMGIQQPPIVGMPIQNNNNNIPTYIPPMQNIPYANDSYISFSNQQTGKGFLDGFKTVFSKIGQFCTDNFGLIIAGLGILGGYNFCSNSMKTYEENKKEGKLDDKGNLKNKDATIKENVMNFVGHGVHNIFGSSNSEEVKEEVKIDKKDTEESLPLQDITQFNTDNEGTLKGLLEKYIMKGNVSNILKIADVKNKNIVKICALEVIIEKFDTIASWHQQQRPETIVKTLNELSESGIDMNIRQRAKDVAAALSKKATYFNEKQIIKLNEIANATIDPSPQIPAETA